MRNGSGEELVLKEQMFILSEDKTGCAWRMSAALQLTLTLHEIN